MVVGMEKITKMTATELLEAYSADQRSVEEVMYSLLDRIETRDPVVKAWAHLDRDLLIDQARRADRLPREQRGPLHGVPIGVKDVIYTKLMPTQFNSSIYTGDHPQVDAASVKILRRAGAIILGKTTTTEFSASTVGPLTTNPHNSRHTPGGSSSGSAAAVADSQVPLALGTQTAGSIIRPSSYTGIFGMKPTWNAVSREGQKFCSINLDTLGWFARSTADLALLAQVFGVIEQAPPITPSTSVKGLKFALFKTPLWEEFAGDGTRKAMELGQAWLISAGAAVEEILLGPEFSNLTAFQRIIMRYDTAVAFRCEYLSAKDKLDPFIIECVENAPTHEEYLEAFDTVAMLRPRWDALARRYAAVIVPSAHDEAPEGLGFTGNQIFNAGWTALHVPVINLPAFSGPRGLPVGLSLVQARFQDRALLQVASAVAEAWHIQA